MFLLLGPSVFTVWKLSFTSSYRYDLIKRILMTLFPVYHFHSFYHILNPLALHLLLWLFHSGVSDGGLWADEDVSYLRSILISSIDGLFSAGQNMSGPISMLWEDRDGSSGQSLVVIKKKPRQEQQEAAEATEGEFSCFRPQRSCCMKRLNDPGCTH